VLICFCICLSLSVVRGQNEQTKEEASGGRLLAQPIPEKCVNRPKHFKFKKHNYFYSGNVQEFKNKKTGKPKKYDWLGARNNCREKCMDTVSLSKWREHLMIKNFIKNNNITYIWTSGRLCDFTGCDRADLKPKNINGWFWSGTQVDSRMAPTNSTPRGWLENPWSQTGHTKDPQPDNAEFDINQTSEACLGLLNNVYEDGIKYHDIGCYHKKPFMCEDSDQLLDYVKSTNPNIRL